MQGRRILIVDDVISTGKSLEALEKLVEKAGGIVVGRAAVLAEGEAAERTDITSLNSSRSSTRRAKPSEETTHADHRHHRRDGRRSRNSRA